MYTSVSYISSYKECNSVSFYKLPHPVTKYETVYTLVNFYIQSILNYPLLHKLLQMGVTKYEAYVYSPCLLKYYTCFINFYKSMKTVYTSVINYPHPVTNETVYTSHINFHIQLQYEAVYTSFKNFRMSYKVWSSVSSFVNLPYPVIKTSTFQFYKLPKFMKQCIRKLLI